MIFPAFAEGHFIVGWVELPGSRLACFMIETASASLPDRMVQRDNSLRLEFGSLYDLIELGGCDAYAGCVDGAVGSCLLS